MREERREFEERERVRGKHIERIAKELVRPCAEIAEMPSVLQHFGEFSDPHEVRRFLFQGIYPDRKLRIAGCNYDKLVAQMSPEPAFTRGN